MGRSIRSWKAINSQFKVQSARLIQILQDAFEPQKHKDTKNHKIFYKYFCEISCFCDLVAKNLKSTLNFSAKEVAQNKGNPSKQEYHGEIGGFGAKFGAYF